MSPVQLTRAAQPDALDAATNTDSAISTMRPPVEASSADLETLQQRRLNHWRQTPETRLPGPEQAASLIEHSGIATLYPVSPELPNLFHAYVGDPRPEPTRNGTAPPARFTAGAGRWGAAARRFTQPLCVGARPG